MSGVHGGQAFDQGVCVVQRLARVLPLLCVPLLSGCVWIAATGVTAGVSAARQERTIGNAIDDERIKAVLDAKLAMESGDLFLRVSTTVIEGRVLLAGRVKTPEDRLTATRIAWNIDGVRKVDNDLDVTDRSGWLDAPTDFIIRTELAAALLADGSIKDVNYTTDVVHGVVYIMGVGQNQAEVDRVIEHARNMSGVKRVENYVVLKDDPSRYGFGTP
jgi:osmotically-inducible protein OsmY